MYGSNNGVIQFTSSTKAAAFFHSLPHRKNVWYWVTLLSEIMLRFASQSGQVAHLLFCCVHHDRGVPHPCVLCKGGNHGLTPLRFMNLGPCRLPFRTKRERRGHPVGMTVDKDQRWKGGPPACPHGSNSGVLHDDRVNNQIIAHGRSCGSGGRTARQTGSTRSSGRRRWSWSSAVGIVGVACLAAELVDGHALLADENQGTSRLVSGLPINRTNPVLSQDRVALLLVSDRPG
jgi:hypothetical protein